MSCDNNTNVDFRPAQYNIQIWKSDTWSQVMRLYANTEPIDLTGSIVEIQVRTRPNATSAVMTLTEADGITIGGEFFNQITINYPVTINAGSYVYDLAVEFPNGNIKTYVWGNFIVYQDITQL